MLPNVVIEYILIRVFTIYGEFQLRKQRQTPLWVKALFLPFPILVDMTIYSFTAYPELYSPALLQGIKTLGNFLEIASRQAIFASGIWGTIVVTAFCDFLAGVSILCRYLIFNGMGISVENYTVDCFQWLPAFVFMITGCLVYGIVIPWVKRYKKFMDDPGGLLKAMGFFYLLPCLFFLRPAEIIDFSKESGLMISGITFLSILGFGWLYLMAYRRGIAKENHYLALHTELFAEHTQVLREQRQLMKLYQRFSGERDGQSDVIWKGAEDAGVLPGKMELLDLVLQNKKKQCEREGILFAIDMQENDIPLKMPEIQFLTVFYNLFQNALEAADKCTGNSRYISLSIGTEVGQLHLSLKNGRLPGKSVGIWRTSKKDTKNHGLGMKIVRDLVKSNDGQMYYMEETDSFGVEVFLPEQDV